MDHRSQRKTPVFRVGAPVRALLLALVVAFIPVTALAASGGQGTPSKAPKGITVSLTPSSRTVDQGQAATYTVIATSTGGFSGPVTFAAAGLPAGTTAAWSPSSVSLPAGGTAQVTLTVGTEPTTAVAKTNFTVTGSSGTVKSNAAPGQLQVLEVKRSFGISGSVAGVLAPGTSRPIDLHLTNTSNKGFGVTNLTVAISQVVRTQTAVAANLPCTVSDYQLTQYSGTYPLSIPVGTSSLSGLGVPQAAWPHVKMLDTLQLQDGCKGATIHFTYSGTGQAD